MDLAAFQTDIDRIKRILQARSDALKAQADMIRSENGFSNSWVGQWQIGRGAFGVANLWLKQDRDGIIVDVSETHFDSRSNWRSPHH